MRFPMLQRTSSIAFSTSARAGLPLSRSWQMLPACLRNISSASSASFRRRLRESSFVYESVSMNPRPTTQTLPAPGRHLASIPTPASAWDVDVSWISPSLLAAHAALHSTAEAGLSDDAYILFIVLSHLAVKEPVPPVMVLRGASSRKRWTQAGEISNTEATDVGLAPELASFLSDATRLDDAFRELGRCQHVGTAEPGAVRRLEDGLYCIDEAAARRLSDQLSSALLTFWEGQALIVAYRAIPWKYLEPMNDAQMSTAARTDLALTLVEASRFPGMSWKRAALIQAEATAAAEEDRPVFLQMGISQNRCVLSRISGDVKGALRFLDAAVSATTASRSIASSAAPNVSTDVRTHVATGQTLIQRALNDIQTECLSTAEQNLAAWSPMGPHHPSPLEQTVLFRQAMIRGRLLRFRGSFSESQECLGSLMHPNQLPDAALVWDEELRDLTCDLADSLRELGRLDEAEACLQAEITRRQGSTHSINCSDEDDAAAAVRKHKTQTLETRERAFLDLALAEVRFARGALCDAYDICVRVLSGPRCRFCTLRGHIILAKVHHVWGYHRLASHHWTEALKAMSHFTLTNGYTTQVILESARENMRHLAQDDLAAQSDAQLAALRLLAVPGGGM
ncbi:hypothetical protein F503_03165 [Ophiostoma piceae UAMH 11346]|uniref:Uncharacterized protein n=1 Tax=Ophiostoma piceae (strain UAMH 11346) TaxID=1262450 RepID=S3CJX6_OPHP1|nr:hypothetical protein F503_03165 [Ophiostoma piceae UAMH 11346]